MSTQDQKFGSCALVGLPNVGKSTLTNALVGSKVSIVTRKVQTTRCRITGIMIQDNSQIVLVDTPGVFAPKTKLDQAMVGAAWDALDETDIVLHIVDAGGRDPLKQNKALLEKLPEGKAILILNKIDETNKDVFLKLAADFNDAHPYGATFMISALKQKGLAELRNFITEAMPKSPWGFDEDDLTDMPMRFMAAEITREKIFLQLHEELPYSIFVETETWEQFDNGNVKIGQVIVVQKDSQKAIVLGKGGSRIKKIGESARMDMSETFGFPVHVKLFVKVQKNWADISENYLKMGL